MDFEEITRQMKRIRKVCEEKEIYFIAYPKTIELDNIRNFFTSCWNEMADRRTHCAFPWLYAEISATGNVTVCHTFYDLSIGNVNETRILDIWKGDRIKRVRKYLQRNLYPICTACSSYYSDPKKH